MAVQKYTSDVGTVYEINDLGFLRGNEVKITSSDGEVLYEYKTGLLNPIGIANGNILKPGSNFDVSLGLLGTYIVLPGATGSMNSVVSGFATVWVGGQLNFRAGAGLGSNTTFNVDGGILTAGAGIGNALSRVTVNLTNGGKFTQNSEGISVLSGTEVNFGKNGGTYVANAGGAFLDLSSVAIKGFNKARDFLEFNNLNAQPGRYKIENSDGLLGFGNAQKITLIDGSGRNILTTTVEGHNFETGTFRVDQAGPLTISSSGRTTLVEAIPSTGNNPCFLAGTLIRTPAGDIPVEDIRFGDEVLAYNNGQESVRSVVWAGKTHCVVSHGAPDDLAGYPVRVLRNAISDGVPSKDMLITSEHCLFLEGKFIPVRMLVNGRSVFYDKSITSYDYYHIETEQHSVIVADGIFTESYLDTGNRRVFRQKGDVVSLGASRSLTWDDAAAELETSREFVEPVYRRIEARVEEVEGVLAPQKARVLTTEAEVRLATDTGVIVNRVREYGDRIMFMIPSGVKTIRILSNSSRPSDVIGPFSDDRRYLGVAVGEITISENGHTRTIREHATDENLDGWNAIEWEDTRWTSGDAFLSLGEERHIENVALLSIQIKAAGPYISEDTAGKASSSVA